MIVFVFLTTPHPHAKKINMKKQRINAELFTEENKTFQYNHYYSIIKKLKKSTRTAIFIAETKERFLYQTFNHFC